MNCILPILTSTTFQIINMKKSNCFHKSSITIFQIFAFLLLTCSLQAQIEVSGGNQNPWNPTNLIENVFLGESSFLFNFTCGNRKGGEEVQYKGNAAYVYPVDSQNRFLELNKIALSKIGFEVKPVNKSFYRNECSGKRQSYVFLNWVEDFVYPPDKCSKLQQFFRFIKAIFLIIFSKNFLAPLPFLSQK